MISREFRIVGTLFDKAEGVRWDRLRRRRGFVQDFVLDVKGVSCGRRILLVWA